MGLTLADTYYLKAKAATEGFCSDWEEVCEALNYALSYDENHCASLCLLGEIYAKHLGQFPEAFTCFDQVIATDNTYMEVYPLYANCLIWADDYKRAQKLIAFALTIKGADKALLLSIASYAEEIQGAYKRCLGLLKKAKKESYNDDFYRYMESEERRIKKKIKLDKPKRKKGNSTKKKK